MFLESHTSQSTIQLASESLADGVFQRSAKPFLKWVGGKTQLIQQLDSNSPAELKSGSIKTYVEPFVGGGSFFFHVAQRYNVEKLIIADSNQDLILAYWTIRDRVLSLIQTLEDMQSKYLSLAEAQREDFYYATRKVFNETKLAFDFENSSDAWVERAAQLIFLNKTCFNGLFRVNAAGLFNVAFGKYVNPKICDPGNLQAVSQILARTQILLGDFSSVLSLVDSKSFVYLDPPYRPLSETSNFTGYSSNSFTDEDQTRLADFCQSATSDGAKLMISNSDPENVGSDDSYFQELYPGYTINRAYASRMVNCKADKRGKISELIITNYATDKDQSEPSPEVTQLTLTTSAATEVNFVALTDVKVASKNSKVEADKSSETKTPECASPDVAESAHVTSESESKPVSSSPSSPSKRSAPALGAFKLLTEYARKEQSFEIAELCEATGWKEQTARTYVSKKWKDYLESVDGAKSKLLKVKKAFLSHTEDSFLAEFSQALSVQNARPQSLDEAKSRARAALLTFAEFLAESQQTSEEARIRALADQL